MITKKQRKKRNKGKKTILDIAKEANVSTATISRYFSDPKVLKAETRQKIKEIVEKSGYAPSLLPPRRSQANSEKIGYLFDLSTELTDYAKPLLNGLLVSCQIYGFDLLTYYVASLEKRGDLDLRDKRRILQNGISTIVCTKYIDDEFVKFCSNNHINICYLISLKDKQTPQKARTKDLIVTIAELNENDVVFGGLLIINLIKRFETHQKPIYRYLVKDNKYKAIKNKKL